MPRKTKPGSKSRATSPDGNGDVCASQFAWAFASFPRFCGLLKVQPKEGGGRVPFLLTPIQRKYCRARTTRDIILKPRQVHMTTVEVARDIWWFLTKSGARVVVVCQSQTDHQALNDISYKIRVFFDSLRQLGIQLKFGRETTTEWTLPDTDATLRIMEAGASVAAASKKGRGGTVNRLHISEAAFFELAETTFNSLMESVPANGSEVVIESTPNGAAGFYYDQWNSAISGGESNFKPHFFAWWDLPDYRIPLVPGETFEAKERPSTPVEKLVKTFLEKGIPLENIKWYLWKIREKGGKVDLVAQEYPSDPVTCFLVSGQCFFQLDKLNELVAQPWTPIRVERHGTLKIFADPVPGFEYVIGADVSEGVGGDESAALVYERITGRHVATIHGQFPPDEYATALGEIGLHYGGALIAVERNNHGHSVLSNLRRDHYPQIFKHFDHRAGWLTHETTRAPMLDDLDKGLRDGSWSTHDVDVLGQMRTFVTNDKGKAEAKSGALDDLVIAAGIGRAVLTMPLNRRRVYDPYGGGQDGEES